MKILSLGSNHQTLGMLLGLNGGRGMGLNGHVRLAYGMSGSYSVHQLCNSRGLALYQGRDRGMRSRLADFWRRVPLANQA